jgi:FlaA1/EpsC-like NDP-sugar epimerase
MASAMFTLAYYFLHDRFFSRLLLVYAGALSFIFTVVWHLAFDQWQRRVLRKSPAAYPVLIIGTNREAERFIVLLQEKQSPLKPVGILDPQGSPKKELAGVPVLGKLNKLEETLKTLRPKYLVQCSNLEHSINLIGACRGHGITYMLLPSVLGVMGGSEEFVQIEGQSMATVRE